MIPRSRYQTNGTNTGTGFPEADIKPTVWTHVQDSQKPTSNQWYEHGYRIPQSRHETNGTNTGTGFPKADIKPTVRTRVQDSQKQISNQRYEHIYRIPRSRYHVKPTVRTRVQDSQKQTWNQLYGHMYRILRSRHQTNGTNTGTGFSEADMKSKAWRPDLRWQAFTQRYGDRFPVADKHVRQQNGYGSHWRPCAISVLIASDHLSCRRETMFLKPSYLRSSRSDSISESVVTRFPAFCSCSVSGNSNKPTLFISTTTGSYVPSVSRKRNVYMRSDLSCIYVA